MESVNPQAQIDAEFKHAEQARSRGNEDKRASVRGARRGLRPANILPGAASSIRTPSAYDLLHLLIEDSTLSDDLRQTAAHLTLRVDEEFKLPANMDLIFEAKKLCWELLKE